RQVAQLGGPVGQLAREHPARFVGGAEGAALPAGEIGVLHRQRGPRRRRARAAGQVGGGQVAGQRGEGPAVGGDVVQAEQPHVLGGGGADGAQQADPDRRRGGHVERRGRGLRQRGGQLVQARGTDGEVGGVGVGGQHHLVRGAVADGVDGAQGL